MSTLLPHSINELLFDCNCDQCDSDNVLLFKLKENVHHVDAFKNNTILNIIPGFEERHHKKNKMCPSVCR